jgi:hypothetical protein
MHDLEGPRTGHPPAVILQSAASAYILEAIHKHLSRAFLCQGDVHDGEQMLQLVVFLGTVLWPAVSSFGSRTNQS